MPLLLFIRSRLWTQQGTAIAGCNAVTQGSPNNGAALKELKPQVLKARPFVHQSEFKAEAIVAFIYEVEKFYPEIKIIRRPAETGEDGMRFFAEDVLIKVA